MILAVALFAAGASEALPPAQDALMRCYAQQTGELRNSSDPVGDIADAIMALCARLEPAARAEIMADSVKSLQASGTPLWQAKEIVESVEEKTKAEARANWRSLIAATILKLRSNRN